jgi:hypothetical protein
MFRATDASAGRTSNTHATRKPPPVPPRPPKPDSAGSQLSSVSNGPVASAGYDWDSDFKDVAYTEAEMAWFNARFRREDAEIAEAQRHWWPEFATAHAQLYGDQAPR